MLVEDILLAEIWAHLKLELARSIESLYMIIGEIDLQVRRSPLSMVKYFKLMCSYVHAQLGVLVNARNLALSTSDNERKCLVSILLTTWNSSRKRFTLREIASLLGLTTSLALATQWVNVLMPHSRIPYPSTEVQIKYHLHQREAQAPNMPD